MIIDIHAHFKPQIMLKVLASQIDRFPNIDLMEDDGKYRLAFIEQVPARPLSAKLRDSDICLGWMDTQSIDPFPIGDIEPLRVIEDDGFDDTEKRMILTETAQELFRIS
ncbi:MAG: hypothetical protein CMF67_02675 [Magnetovibrio sp.]|nr:hypothetical protein [Magnetovibrio sp.]|tara:strand:+ start:131 stop:457 length:327 start_codon:yes stop_codon:yes gene_type:complete